jgi:hypothetical protein
MYLNSHSCYSLRYGVLTPVQLVAAASERGVKALALTDINNTSCTHEFVTRCRAAGISARYWASNFGGRAVSSTFGLARSETGFAALCQFLSDCSIDDVSASARYPARDGGYLHYLSPMRCVLRISCVPMNISASVPRRYIPAISLPLVSVSRHKLVAWAPITFLEQGWPSDPQAAAGPSTPIS